MNHSPPRQAEDMHRPPHRQSELKEEAEMKFSEMPTEVKTQVLAAYTNAVSEIRPARNEEARRQQKEDIEKMAENILAGFSKLIAG